MAAIPMTSIIMALTVGTKLHAIASKLTRISFEHHDYNHNDKLDLEEWEAMRKVTDLNVDTLASMVVTDGMFWFGKPQVLLLCMQFIMFQNSLEL